MMIYVLHNISILRDIVLYILEYKLRFLFPSQTLETRHQNKTGIYKASVHTDSQNFQKMPS